MVWQDSALMARKRPRKWGPLKIGKWLVFLERQQEEVAEKAGINKGYLSQLISGEKDNPSGDKLMSLSTELGISVNALYSDPPPVSMRDRYGKLRPDQLESLGTLLDERNKSPDRN